MDRQPLSVVYLLTCCAALTACASASGLPLTLTETRLVRQRLPPALLRCDPEPPPPNFVFAGRSRPAKDQVEADLWAREDNETAWRQMFEHLTRVAEAGDTCRSKVMDIKAFDEGAPG